jgi:sacsin
MKTLSFTRFDGTLFRFPFRTSSLAQTSEIKRISYSEADMVELLALFGRSLSLTMLFLRHIQTIEVYQVVRENETMQLLYQASVPTRPRHFLDTFGSTKEAFYRRLREKATQELIHHHVLDVKLTTSVVKTNRSDHQANNEEESITERYLITHAMGGAQAKAMALQHPELKLIPYVGIAAPMDDKHETEGRAFCFLPLPVKVGLPVHVIYVGS